MPSQAGKRNGMQMFCNWYVEKQLKIYKEEAGKKSSLYNFEHVHRWKPDENLTKGAWKGTQYDILLKYGFVTIIKGTAAYEKWIQEFEERSGKKATVIYSMWEGYISSGKYQDKELAEFCKKHDAISMHTSGHAYMETIEKVINEINPTDAIYPIHTEYPQKFLELQISEEQKRKVRGMRHGVQKRNFK